MVIVLGNRFAKKARSFQVLFLLSAILQILVLSDSKLGHENQSLGLAEAMARQRPAEIHMLRFSGKGELFAKVREISAIRQRVPKLDFIITAGHATHLACLYLARRYKASSIVLMKPSLPSACFDWCICPEHDFFGKKIPRNVITSKGALNRVIASNATRMGKLFLIGGPSKTHGWDEMGLRAEIKTIAGDEAWLVADSRRTPDGFLKSLKQMLPQLACFPHQETQQGWLAEKLATLEQVFVTEDSVSMIYEALSSGAKVGVISMPCLRPNSRIIRGLEQLRHEGYFDPKQNLKPLSEAERCAEILLAE
jgi:mitochondrial fission protein ELM1